MGVEAWMEEEKLVCSLFTLPQVRQDIQAAVERHNKEIDKSSSAKSSGPKRSDIPGVNRSGVSPQRKQRKPAPKPSATKPDPELKLWGGPKYICQHRRVEATHSSRERLGRAGSKYKKGWKGTLTGYDNKKGKYMVTWDAGEVKCDGFPLAEVKETLISPTKFKNDVDRRRLLQLPPSNTVQDRLADAEDFQI